MLNQPQTTTDMSNISVLMVEDDPLWHRLVGQALKTANTSTKFTLATAGSLDEAQTAMQSQSYDLVLLDLGLPDSFGIVTYDSMRQAQPEMPIIILTGNDDNDAGVEAIARGADDYLTKGASSFKEMIVRSALFAIQRRRNACRV